MSQNWDVIVVGAGPAGASAAIAAARSGCRVLAVERYGFAGGMATAAFVNPFAGNCYVNPKTGAAGDIVLGIFAEVLANLQARNAVARYLFSPARTRFYDAFDEHELRMVYDRMLADAGVEVLFHAQLLDAKCAGGRVESIRVLTRGGQVQTLTARMFIDSTGDGDLAAAVGVPFDVGREGDGLTQPCTTKFRMGGVDKGPLMADGLDAARARVTEQFLAAREAGRIDFPHKNSVMFYDHPHPGALHFNATRVIALSALDSWQLGEAERRGREQVRVLADWLRAEVPAFRNAFIEAMGPQIGVRETRRIRGRYTMTGDDIRRGARFDDGIMRSGYFIDIHSPTGAGDPHTKDGRLGAAKADFIPKQYYEVPMRCLQPEGPGNLLVACRAISTTFEAHAAVRVMANMHAVGEAAGVAAGIAKRQSIEPGDVDGRLVRDAIGYLNAEPDF